MPGKRKTTAVKKSKRKGDKTPPLRRLMKVMVATILLIILVSAAGFTVLSLFPVGAPLVKATAPKKTPHPIVFEIYPGEKPPPPETTPAADREAVVSIPPSTSRQPRIAIIIDDVGYDREMARHLIALDPSLTLSILPDSPYNKEIASAANKAGLEIMLHLPMEPVEYPAVDPGPGVLLASMSPGTLIGRLDQDIADVPFIKGVNNHMGSKLTADSIQLDEIFSVLKTRDLFFIDSRTTGKSLCGPSARKLELPFAERDVFLDNSLSEADITRQLNRLVDIAGRRGTAIGIGHPHPQTYRVLAQQLPSVKQRVQLVPASSLVHITGEAGKVIPPPPSDIPTPPPPSDP